MGTVRKDLRSHCGYLHQPGYFLRPSLCLGCACTLGCPLPSLSGAGGRGWRSRHLLDASGRLFRQTSTHQSLAFPKQAAVFGFPSLDPDASICLAGRLESLGSCSLSLTKLFPVSKDKGSHLQVLPACALSCPCCNSPDRGLHQFLGPLPLHVPFLVTIYKPRQTMMLLPENPQWPGAAGGIESLPPTHITPECRVQVLTTRTSECDCIRMLS